MGLTQPPPDVHHTTLTKSSTPTLSLRTTLSRLIYLLPSLLALNTHIPLLHLSILTRLFLLQTTHYLSILALHTTLHLSILTRLLFLHARHLTTLLALQTYTTSLTLLHQTIKSGTQVVKYGWGKSKGLRNKLWFEFVVFVLGNGNGIVLVLFWPGWVVVVGGWWVGRWVVWG